VLAASIFHFGEQRAGDPCSRDPEGVHQLRVGLRRLQMALKSFGAETSGT
jgi:CHAD domain-containing protein